MLKALTMSLDCLTRYNRGVLAISLGEHLHYGQMVQSAIDRSNIEQGADILAGENVQQNLVWKVRE